MSTISIQPSNTICYIEKPPKPLGPPPEPDTLQKLDDEAKKAGTVGDGVLAKVDTPNSPVGAKGAVPEANAVRNLGDDANHDVKADENSAPGTNVPKPSINAIGQTIGSVINTEA